MKKSTIIILVVIVLAVAAYFYFEGTSPSPAADSSLQQSSDTTGVGSDVLGLLNQIQSLSIDTTFFGQPAYQTLRDYSVTIPSEPVGRVNPFAPLPGVSNPDGTGAPAAQ